MVDAPRSESTHRQALLVVLFAAVVVALAALRATLGLSFYDDSYYVVIPLRFAHGARLFVDELSVQSLGELVSVPFVKVYEALFGLTGIVLFVRELYVAMAALVGIVLYRLLRRGGAGPAAALVAVTVPLLTVPYHLIAPTYNTVAQMCFTLSIVLGWSAMRDGRARLAGVSGVLIAVGAAAYPPFAIAALVLLLTFALMARKRALILAALGGAVLAAALIAAAILIGLSADDLRRTVAFASANVGSIASPLDKLGAALVHLGGALFSPWLWPMWACALLASIPPLPRQLRAVALIAIPVTAAAPGISLLAQGNGFSFGSAVSSWLITLTLGIAVPSIVWALSAGRRDFLRLVALATPFGLTGYLTVAWVTNSSWNRGTGSIALAPLALGLLLCWSTAIGELWEEGVEWTAVVLIVLVAFGLLFANIFSDPLSLTSHTLVTNGPYAGLTMSDPHASQLGELGAAGRRWVGPDTRVTFLGERETYLAVGGIWDTPAVWLSPAPSDRATIEYYDRRGKPAQVVFVDGLSITPEGGYAAKNRDPYLAYVLGNYHQVGSAALFDIFVRNK